MAKTKKHMMDEMDDVELVLFSIQCDLRKAYNDDEPKRVTHGLIDILEAKVPERELKFLADYLKSKHNYE